jgi:hypothetical protein
MRARSRVNNAMGIKRELDMHCVLPGWCSLAVKDRMNDTVSLGSEKYF